MYMFWFPNINPCHHLPKKPARARTGVSTLPPHPCLLLRTASSSRGAPWVRKSPPRPDTIGPRHVPSTKIFECYQLPLRRPELSTGSPEGAEQADQGSCRLGPLFGDPGWFCLCSFSLFSSQTAVTCLFQERQGQPRGRRAAAAQGHAGFLGGTRPRLGACPLQSQL